jgi:toxin ParE1/3/4
VIVRYTRPAAADLSSILEYLLERSKTGANSVLDEIESAERLLKLFPLAGRPTSTEGVRKLNLRSHPYCIFYEASGGYVTIHHIRHTSRDSRSMPGE